MAKDTVERHLAAILFADVVSYSRMMSEDEAATLHDLQQHRFALIDPTIGQYRGRIVKLLGDGILVEFPSVIEAVNCAVKIQNAMVTRNEGKEESRQIRFRIGINLGDVIADDGDIYGDGVNVAARLQEIADPNCIAISSRVFGMIDGEVDYQFADIGAHQLKNIANPVRVFHYSPTDDVSPSKHAFRPFVDIPEKEIPLITGGCMCGSVRYKITEKPLGSMICHCRMCQHFSGAPILAGTTMLAEALKFTKGKPKFYQSSSIAQRGFCPECGSALVYQGIIGQWTKWTMVFTASLDEPEKYPPTYHMGIESSMPWLHIHDELPRTMSKNSPSLVEAYNAVGETVP